MLVVARTRGAAQKLTAAFRERDTKKIYWSLVKGVPRKHEDKISTWLTKDQTDEGDRMRVCKHGEEGADHAVTYYRVIDTAAQNLAWLEMEPYTGRTHQLRVHALHIGHPIIGDPKYFIDDHNWDFPVASRSACTCMRASSTCRIRMAAASRSPHRCRRIWSRPGTCSASTSVMATGTSNETGSVRLRRDAGRQRRPDP